MKLFGFTETQRFVRRVTDRLPDKEYAELQFYLCENPDEGDIIPRGGGIRKIRWRIAGKGKRGGVRVIYFWLVGEDKILMLDIYAKNEKADLTQNEIQQMKRIVKDWKYEKGRF